MNTQEVIHNGIIILEVLPGEERLSTEQDALDLIGELWDNDRKRMLIHREALHDDFFNLRTGLAGAAMLKWSNYRIATALVLPPEIASEGRLAKWCWRPTGAKAASSACLKHEKLRLTG